MSKIDYQALREAAVAIETVATPQKLLAFRMKVTPQVVLALLDELERKQQYIKDGEWPIDNGTIEVYAAPPVPVVPAALPENDDE
ncbi:ead/Ea22-like family protein, partial [Escherichia coli]|uniref:ead/Ea22-like family protein n=1 Tax=Escherichia coli TaxID=562 RepID=UPI001BC8767E